MIMYFSATGNSKYCAEFIASHTGDEIVSMNDMMKKHVNVIDCSGQKKIGIVAPTYDMDLAYAVSEFLDALDFQNVPDDCYVYGVFTCGSISGDCADTLKSILEKKNMKLNSAFVVVMPDNYVPMFKQKDENTKQAMLRNADVTLNSIVHDINDRIHTFMPSKKLPRIAMFFMRKFFMPSQRKVKSFSVNDECIGCGLCVKVCPMNIITLKENKPVWTEDKCACCLACLHRCPKHAINRGKSAVNGRYLNPNVNW